jgi:hypothetical protein
MGILLGSFVLGLIAVNLVIAQQRFGGFGGGGGGGGGGVLALINRSDVKKELEITDDQLEKVPDAVQKALADVLNEKQLKRLRQLDLQQRGVRAFSDTKVQAQLKITDEQKENIKTIIEESNKERAELFKGAKDDIKGAIEKGNAITKETNDKIQTVLTADQRKLWKSMLGEEFKFEQGGGFGGFGGFGKGKFKKKDAE